MRLEPTEPKNESGLYTYLRDRTLGAFFLERVEPANESGFPDIYFVDRQSSFTSEGTIELKYAKTAEPNLKTLMRGNQKAALLDYLEVGGRRRFALCYCNGFVHFWNTAAFVASIKKDGRGWTAKCELSEPEWNCWGTQLRDWLRR